MDIFGGLLARVVFISDNKSLGRSGKVKRFFCGTGAMARAGIFQAVLPETGRETLWSPAGIRMNVCCS